MRAQLLEAHKRGCRAGAVSTRRGAAAASAACHSLGGRHVSAATTAAPSTWLASTRHGTSAGCEGDEGARPLPSTALPAPTPSRRDTGVGCCCVPSSSELRIETRRGCGDAAHMDQVLDELSESGAGSDRHASSSRAVESSRFSNAVWWLRCASEK